MYAVACFLPALKVANTRPMSGWECLTAIPTLWWWANPLYFVGLLTYWRRYYIISSALTGFAVLIAIHFEWLFWSEADGLLPGCVLWVTSLQIAAINAIWHMWIDRKNRHECLLSDILD